MLTGVNTSNRGSTALAALIVGRSRRVFDRALAASQTIAALDLLKLDTATGYWKKSTLVHRDAAEWAADTETAIGDVVVPTTPNGHFYQATDVDGDAKTHAETEPTWPTDGSTVVDDGVTWTDMGTIDLVTDTFGVALEAATTTSDHPSIAVVQEGAVLRSAVHAIPDSLPVGYVLGNLILT